MTRKNWSYTSRWGWRRRPNFRRPSYTPLQRNRAAFPPGLVGEPAPFTPRDLRIARARVLQSSFHRRRQLAALGRLVIGQALQGSID